MCGFFFCYKKNNIPIEKKLFINSSKLLSHRGPDDLKYFFDKKISGSFYRLSIQDVSKLGSQPMLSKSKKNIIFFNGEIYNYLELKKYLNMNLKSNSDTEVLINLIEKFGTKILSKVKGMFSIVIYNFEKQEILLIRDRFGIKPLYYYEDNNFFLVSSEIKPIKYFNKINEFNDSTFGDFFFKGYMHHDKKTFFKDIFQLESSNLLRIKNGKKYFKKYWDLKENINNDVSLSQAKDKLDNLFEKSMRQHMISDVEIGSFLSGGNDSSSISLIAKKIQKKIKTFTYGFKNYEKLKDDEIKIAKSFAKKNYLENFSQSLSYEDIENNLNKIIKIVETPITSIRLVAFDKIYRLASRKNIKVILEGHGGDELLGGYKNNWLPAFIDNNYKNYNSKKLVYKIFSKKNIDLIGFNNLVNHIYCLNSQGNFTSDASPYLIFDLFDSDFINNYFNSQKNLNKNSPKKLTLLQKYQFNEIKNIHLPRVLNYVDKISMANGIETRLPFLDHELFEYAFNLPTNFKFKFNTDRYIWKQIFKSYQFKKNKKTIVDPQREFFKENSINKFYDEITSSKVRNSGYFNKKNIELYLNHYKKSRKLNNSFGLMQIFSASKFLNIFSN
jgi:asparagine synthase (glutamine-hydrolysing)